MIPALPAPKLIRERSTARAGVIGRNECAELIRLTANALSRAQSHAETAYHASAGEQEEHRAGCPRRRRPHQHGAYQVKPPQTRKDSSVVESQLIPEEPDTYEQENPRGLAESRRQPLRVTYHPEGRDQDCSCCSEGGEHRTRTPKELLRVLGRGIRHLPHNARAEANVKKPEQPGARHGDDKNTVRLGAQAVQQERDDREPYERRDKMAAVTDDAVTREPRILGRLRRRVFSFHVRRLAWR
jgi:hypothetical protein